MFVVRAMPGFSLADVSWLDYGGVIVAVQGIGS